MTVNHLQSPQVFKKFRKLEIRNEKYVYQMGTAIIDHRPKTHVNRYFRAVFDNA